MSTTNRSSGITAENTDLDSIREDLTSLKEDFKSLMTDLAAGGRHAAQLGAQTITDGARTAVDQVKSFQNATCDTVRSHPMASVLIAAGVGAIAARLLMFRGGHR